MFERRHLDHVVLDIELVLISVVQGVALSTLAIVSAPLLREHRPETWCFVGSGLAFVLSFWAVSLIHAVSFVRWPMDLVHYFFYFGLAFCECLTFASMAHPHDWFGWSLACFVLTWALYAYDDRLIRRGHAAHATDAAGRALHAHVVRRQRFELAMLIPGGIAFSLAAWIVVGRTPRAALPMAIVQLLLTVGFVADFVRSFRERQRRIAACIHEG